jgi:hypothetical protein
MEDPKFRRAIADENAAWGCTLLDELEDGE